MIFSFSRIVTAEKSWNDSAQSPAWSRNARPAATSASAPAELARLAGEDERRQRVQLDAAPPRRRLRPASRAGAGPDGSARRTGTRSAARRSRSVSVNVAGTPGLDSAHRNGRAWIQRSRLARRESRLRRQPFWSWRCEPSGGSVRAGHADRVARQASSLRAATSRPRGILRSTRMRIFSGIQPTGQKHLGNYIGGFRQYVATQELRRGVLLHRRPALDHGRVRPRRPSTGRRSTWRRCCSRAGLDPDRSTVFAQSHVTAHAGGGLAARARSRASASCAG